jgi:hypothetical protein
LNKKRRHRKVSALLLGSQGRDFARFALFIDAARIDALR